MNRLLLACSANSVIEAANELVLNFALSLLDDSGPHYLPAVKLVVALCTGEEPLDESDVAYLREVLKLSSFKMSPDDQGTDVARDKAESGEREGTATPTPGPRTDSRVEAQKLFDKIKSGRRKVHRGGTGHQTESFPGSTPQRDQKRWCLVEWSVNCQES